MRAASICAASGADVVITREKPFRTCSRPGIRRPQTRAIIVQSLCPICFATYMGCSPAESIIEAEAWRVWSVGEMPLNDARRRE